jgi:hypothetical protein
MYSINLAEISLDRFAEILVKAQLLPTQKVILNNLSKNMQKLKDRGLPNLQELHNFLKKNENYPSVAQETGIDPEYLVILNRMVNSFIVKSIPLAKLEIFTNEELNALASLELKSTQQYYETLLIAKHRKDVSTQTHIPVEKVEYALRIIDLLRINGVGVEYAKILYEIGIKSVADYNHTPSETILMSVKQLNAKKMVTKATLGISDIDYCRRFCEQLDCEIE